MGKILRIEFKNLKNWMKEILGYNKETPKELIEYHLATEVGKMLEEKE